MSRSRREPAGRLLRRTLVMGTVLAGCPTARFLATGALATGLLTTGALAAGGLATGTPAPLEGTAEPQPLQGAAAEEFLRTARVIDVEEIPVGVTNPQRLTLSDGARTADAVWKTIDEYAPVKDFHDGRPVELGFRDSWKHELAAFHLDKLLGLELVPPTVARTIDGVDGALQLWVENAMTDTERRKRDLQAPDVAAWNRQIYTVRLLRQLTHDTDFNNTGNLLVGEGFRVWAIDHSRAFKTRKRLLAEGDLERFPARLLERLRALRARQLEAAVGEWLTPRQRAALLARRDLIVARADRLIAERGAAAVLLP